MKTRSTTPYINFNPQQILIYLSVFPYLKVALKTQALDVLPGVQEAIGKVLTY